MKKDSDAARASEEANPAEVMFSPAVRRAQEERGSRRMQQKREDRGDFPTALTPDARAYIESRDSVYLASAGANAQPYIQHRGGPRGFLKVLDDRTLAFADFAGNRQYITAGNLSENDRVFLFLMDYANRQRLKIWGKARIVEDDPALIGKLMPDEYRAKAERAIVIDITAWDVNCPQHIVQRFDLEEINAATGGLRQRLEALEVENAELKRRLEAIEGPETAPE